MDNQKTLDHLADMLTRNYDAEAGYKKITEIADNEGLKTFSKEQAENRYEFGHKIKEEIKRLGGDVDKAKGTSFIADLHRVWIGMRDAISSGDNALIAEMIRGEKAFVEEYDEALNASHYSEGFKNIIRHQKSQVEQTISKLKSMEAVK